MTVVELYEVSHRDFNPLNLLFGGSAASEQRTSYQLLPVEALTQSFISPVPAKLLAVTRTEQGLTSKQVRHWLGAGACVVAALIFAIRIKLIREFMHVYFGCVALHVEVSAVAAVQLCLAEVGSGRILATPNTPATRIYQPMCLLIA